MKKLFLLLVAVLSIGLCASAQTRTVKGTVLDAANDEPLVGVSVTAGSNAMGVTTDVDGDFTIVVPESAKHLTVSYVGYETQTVAISGSKIVVRLKSSVSSLDEVIAVAYGTAKRSEYTGAASVVKADQLEDALVANVVTALNGKVSGVQTTSSTGQPGSSPTVRIRGTGSINASSAPLYVVDGVPYMGDPANISPQDIVEMTVLKDAASTALYGARGANGVILITTKKGQEGQAVVTFDARWGSNSRALPNYDVITDSREWMELYYQALNNTQMNFFGLSPVAANAAVNNEFWSAVGYQTWTVPEGQALFDMNGKFNPYATPGYSNGRYYFIADDWEKETLIHGLRQEYNVSVSGGTDRLQYYLSGTYLEDEGIIKGSHFNRLTTRATVDYQAKKWLKIGTSMSYVYSNSGDPRDNDLGAATSSGNAFYFVNGLPPMYPVYIRDAEGQIVYNKVYNNPVYDYGDNKDYGNGLLGAGRMPQGNPAGALLYDTNDYLSDIFDAKWYAVLTPIKGLSIVENVGYFLNNQRAHTLLNPLYGQFQTMGGQVVQSQARTYDVTLQTLVSYNHTFADVHEMDLMAGYESEEYAVENLSAQGSNLYQAQVPFVSNTIDQKDGSGSRRELSHRGFLFRGKYTYDGRYYFMGSVRRDGSSRFAPGHRWGTFWSLSAGWDIAKEKFMEPYKGNLLDLLKFRASFGQNGNDGIGSSTLYMPWADFYIMEGANGVFNDGSLAQKGNVDLTWETSNAFNVGVDFSFWKGMLTGTVEYYNRQTEDMLFNLPVAPSLGYSSIPSNIGSMRNNGFEIDLNYRPVNTKDITWDIYANITFGWNKILKLPKDIMTEVTGEPGRYEWIRGTYQHLEEGGSIYDLYLPQYAGVLGSQEELDAMAASDHKYTDLQLGQSLFWMRDPVMGEDADGNKIQTGWGEPYKTNDWAAARTSYSKHMGRIAPLAYGGFGTTVNAYGIDLTLNFSYQFGGKMIDTGYQNTMSTASVGAFHKDLHNAWSPSNPTSDIPALYTQAKKQYATSMSDRFLVSSNYLQLTNITLGYTLPKSFTGKFGIESLRIYGSAENVALWTKRKGLDPRQVMSASNNYGSNNYTYSPIRAISGGIRVSF